MASLAPLSGPGATGDLSAVDLFPARVVVAENIVSETPIKLKYTLKTLGAVYDQSLALIHRPLDGVFSNFRYSGKGICKLNFVNLKLPFKNDDGSSEMKDLGVFVSPDGQPFYYVPVCNDSRSEPKVDIKPDVRVPVGIMPITEAKFEQFLGIGYRKTVETVGYLAKYEDGSEGVFCVVKADRPEEVANIIAVLYPPA
jgi:hypothetical protein